MKRTFTKYPNSYVRADSDYTKRLLVYYISKTTASTKENLLNAMLDEALEKYGADAHFGYYNAECRSYGRDACLCVIDVKKPISKSKLKSIIEDELDIAVVDIKTLEHYW